MKNSEIQQAFNSLNTLAKEEKFVYSLSGNSLKQALNYDEITNPISITISFSAFLKLKFFHEDILILAPDNKYDNFFPALQFGDINFILNILIESNKELINTNFLRRCLKQINNQKFIDIIIMMDQIFTEEPSIWSYLFRDKNNKVQLIPLTRINPYYYKVLEIDGLKIPYLEYFKNNY
ncbi:hypothetical protein [Mycoplasma seminis]|uniref:Uncharacterized protein n=1 Tax=Mycoplasma seminis TaxID=512749 RepID=A0ABY9HD11_9MOLU|nr:hypothetical protein [Mycoplasma seminis]WLP85563.1 hypothetical protein Q8852_00085 [Mycoplasma seminis]